MKRHIFLNGSQQSQLKAVLSFWPFQSYIIKKVHSRENVSKQISCPLASLLVISLLPVLVKYRTSV